MNLAFASEDLRERCEKLVEGQHAYGFDVAQELRERLASMREAQNVSELLTGQPHELVEGSDPCYAVHLLENWRMVFSANHRKLPLQEGTGKVDWSRVSRVIILRIEQVGVGDG